MTSKFVPVPKSIISSNLKGITVSAPPGTIKPGLPSVVLLNLYPPKSLFNIHHYYTKSIKYFFFIINLYSDLGGCQFGFTFDGLPGYKKVGADTVYPFKGWYYLGEGYSFDLKSFTDYSHFTIDNFIVGSSSAGASQSGGHGEFNTYAKINGFSLSKSYDNKLGILTINGYSQLAGCWDIDGYWRYTVTQNVKCFAYLIYK